MPTMALHEAYALYRKGGWDIYVHLPISKADELGWYKVETVTPGVGTVRKDGHDHKYFNLTAVATFPVDPTNWYADRSGFLEAEETVLLVPAGDIPPFMEGGFAVVDKETPSDL